MFSALSIMAFGLWVMIIVGSWAEVIRRFLFESFGIDVSGQPNDQSVSINRWMWGTDMYGPLTFTGEFATGNSNYYFLMWHSCNGFPQMVVPGIRALSIDQLECLRFLYLETETAPSND